MTKRKKRKYCDRYALGKCVPFIACAGEWSCDPPLTMSKATPVMIRAQSLSLKSSAVVDGGTLFTEYSCENKPIATNTAAENDMQSPVRQRCYAEKPRNAGTQNRR